MLSHPKGVRPRLLAVVAVLVALAGWVVQRLAGGRTQLATAGWLTVILLAAMAVVVYAAGIPVR
ncbi:MAG TPA: hypothetical protein VHM65_03835, partial [Candidatus Lustribacter sp.]|nr:hypothetical protein [Candidatus Lustribacter sp.]